MYGYKVRHSSFHEMFFLGKGTAERQKGRLDVQGPRRDAAVIQIDI
jgi:hypothetical protein